ncbi:MAG: N-acetylmuramoyl-L-alanine amidase-like domain-containing protein [Oligoflexales bacterium]
MKRYKNFSLDLGRWNHSTLENLMEHCQVNKKTANERIAFWMEELISIPFAFESQRMWPEKGHIRVDLETMDCMTLVYYVLALSRSRDINEFLSQICSFRYHGDGLIDSDPEKGNIFNFASEAFLKNAISRKIFIDLTSDLVPKKYLGIFSANLKKIRRAKLIDINQNFISPITQGRVRSEFIVKDGFPYVFKDKIKSGDLILFGKKNKNDDEELPMLIAHLGFVYRPHDETNGKIGLYHSTRHFHWNPNGNIDSRPRFTGFFYDTERKKEQIGTGVAGVFAGEHTKTIVNPNSTCYGMNQDEIRSIFDYASFSFDGFKILRPL